MLRVLRCLNGSMRHLRTREDDEIARLIVWHTWDTR